MSAASRASRAAGRVEAPAPPANNSRSHVLDYPRKGADACGSPQRPLNSYYEDGDDSDDEYSLASAKNLTSQQHPQVSYYFDNQTSLHDVLDDDSDDDEFEFDDDLAMSYMNIILSKSSAHAMPFSARSPQTAFDGVLQRGRHTQLHPEERNPRGQGNPVCSPCTIFT